MKVTESHTAHGMDAVLAGTVSVISGILFSLLRVVRVSADVKRGAMIVAAKRVSVEAFMVISYIIGKWVPGEVMSRKDISLCIPLSEGWIEK